MFSRVEGLRAAYLLGSAAAGRLRKDSDVDFAILLDPLRTLSLDEQVALVSELEGIMRREIDLGRMTPDGLVYAKEAICSGVRVYCRERTDVELFEATALALYVELRRNRREVEASYAA